MLELIYANGPKRGQTIAINVPSITFGRSDAVCQVALAWDGSVSSRHFEVVQQGDQFVIVDLGSRNGTRLNGRVIDRAPLSDMDRIEVGATLLVVRCVESTASATPPSTAPQRPVSNSPIEESSWKLRASSPIEGSFADFQPVDAHDQRRDAPYPNGPDAYRSDAQNRDVPDAGVLRDESDSGLWERSSQRIPTRSSKSKAIAQTPASVAASPDHSRDSASDAALPASDLPKNPTDEGVGDNGSAQARVPQVIRQVRVRIQEGYGQVQQRLYWIGPGELLTIGRSSASDCCLPHDGRLSPQHFVIQSTDHSCTVTDLRSDDGTWLNGARIQESPLFHGDVIWAGACVFLIEIETLDGFLHRSALASSDSKGPSIVRKAAAPSMIGFAAVNLQDSTPMGTAAAERARRTEGKKSATSNTVPVEGQTLADDVYALLGQFSEALTPAELLKRLMELGAVYLVVDPSRITLPFPESCDCCSSKLFQWLPDVAAARTPNLFKASELLDPVAYWEESLGCDAVICLVSPLPKAKLLEALRESLRNPVTDSQMARGIVGICWPSSLRAIMDQGTFGVSNKLFESVHCVLTEHGSANKWRLCVREKAIGERLIQRWAAGGLRLEVDEL